jgi:SsrA-binding protein
MSDIKKKDKEERQRLFFRNKKAKFEYFIIDTWTAGIMLKGSEIKSLRYNGFNFTDPFCYIKDGEIWIKNLVISQYDYSTYQNHDPNRDKKLLLKKREILKIISAKTNGLTLIPIVLFENDKSLIKVEISLCKGKKLYDKRETIKTRDLDRYEKNKD